MTDQGWMNPELRCWARHDDAPPFEQDRSQEHGFGRMCGEEPADDLGLCPHHRTAILGRPVAVPAKIQPATRALILAWLDRLSAGTP